MGWKFVVACLGVVGFAVHYAVPTPEAVSAPPTKANNDWRTSRAFSQDVVEAAVRPQLRDPQSAIFRDLSATNDRKIGQSPAGLVVCGHVNAKNGFGGYTGEKPFINFYGTMLTEIEPTPRTKKFNAAWNKLCAG
jgi:hypothetical protein